MLGGFSMVKEVNENLPKEVRIQPRCEKLVDMKQIKEERSILEEKTIYTKISMSRNMGERVKESNYGRSSR